MFFHERRNIRPLTPHPPSFKCVAIKNPTPQPKTPPQPVLPFSSFLYLHFIPGSRIVPAAGTVSPFHCITAPAFWQPAPDPLSIATNQLTPSTHKKNRLQPPPTRFQWCEKSPVTPPLKCCRRHSCQPANL